MKYLLLTLVALVVSDGLLSQYLIRYGLGREGNPFLQSLVSEEIFLPIKLAGALLGAIILWDIHRTHPMVALVLTLVFMILYTGVVFWNLGAFFITQA